MFKFYIGFPISLNCNLRCEYCFHKEFYNFIDKGIGINKWHSQRTFSLEDYRQWRDNHLVKATDLVMHLYGGEPFCIQNVDDVFEIINFMDKERIDILTNGIGSIKDMERLRSIKAEKFHRIGFTYHRKIMRDNKILSDRFRENVFLVKSMGFPVYVKELLIKEYRDEILEDGTTLNNRGELGY